MTKKIDNTHYPLDQYPFQVRNWERFQHYKDRAPPWLKLHRDLIDNIDYHQLPPLAAKVLTLLWIIASEANGALPSSDRLAFRLRISIEETEAALDALTAGGFVVLSGSSEQLATTAQEVAQVNGYGSRHIPDAIKRLVWKRDAGKCQQCGTKESIEYDHIHPVSQGGNSGEENIQLLCRPCNRSKRAKLAKTAERVATQELDSRILEGEGEGETETEGETEKIGVPLVEELTEAPFDLGDEVAVPEEKVSTGNKKTPKSELFARARALMGPKSGMALGQLIKLKGEDYLALNKVLDLAEGSTDPGTYVFGVVKKEREKLKQRDLDEKQVAEWRPSNGTYPDGDERGFYIKSNVDGTKRLYLDGDTVQRLVGQQRSERRMG